MTDKEKLEKIKSLADKMYTSMQYLTSDTRPIRKAMEEYHSFIVHEYHKEEPVSEDVEKAAKHHLYSNILYDDVYVGNPTDEDCIEMFKAGTEWKKQQIKDKVLIWLNNNVGDWIDMPYDQNSFIRHLENVMED